MVGWRARLLADRDHGPTDHEPRHGLERDLPVVDDRQAARDTGGPHWLDVIAVQAAAAVVPERVAVAANEEVAARSSTRPNDPGVVGRLERGGR